MRCDQRVGDRGLLYLWPALERRITGDREHHHLLDRPRDNPLRTAVGWAVLTFVAPQLFAGVADRVMVEAGIDYQAQIWAYRAAVVVVPVVAFVAASTVRRELRAAELRPTLG